MSLIEKQFEKEKAAAKKVWGIYLKIVLVFWGLIGLICLFSPAWPVGIIFIGGAYYVLYRIKAKQKII